jgi:hypothetical protein
MSSKQGNIGVTSENIFPIIKKFTKSSFVNLFLMR